MMNNLVISTPQAARSRGGGFTLLEVALAIGVVSFALIAILGSMATGASTLRRAADTATQAQIAQSLLGSAGQSDFSVLTAAAPAGWDGKTNSFDERGFASATNAIYTATTKVLSPVSIPGTASPNNKLAKVSVTIVKNANTNDIFTVSEIVASNGQ